MTEFWNDLTDLSLDYPQIHCEIEDEDGLVLISALRCDAPGNGIGTRFMGDLLELADRHQLDISVDPPEPDDDRIVQWYEGLGFYFENSLRMVRVPEPALRMG